MQNYEIERKWLIDKVPVSLGDKECLHIEQAYLSFSPTVRVRKENDACYLTYKGAPEPGGSGIKHSEYNLPLDAASYEHLREKRDGILIKKDRFLIPIEKGLTIELDVFKEKYEGLKVAEVEFESEEEAESFTPPDWFGRDVTGEAKYKNACMAKGWEE